MSDPSLPSTIPDDRSGWFDRAWQQGRRPRIEDYLDTCPEDERPALFDLLFGIELERRRESGERPEPADYDTRFPEYGTSIRNVLAGLQPVDETIQLQPAATVPYAGDITPTPGHPQADGGDGPLVGRRIGPYTLQEFLGRGNFLVYKALDSRGGLPVALKLARPDFPESRRRLTSLADEANLLAGLDHPRIVRLHEYIPPGGPGIGADGCIALEYVEGRPGERTLEELLESGPVPAPRLIRIAALVAEALHHAHTHAGHLTHRDLKPANILLDLDGEPRVCDFGLAIDEEIQRLRRGEVAGTPPYMAPEQVLGETHRLDGRTDLWALGVILYRGLTRRMPFEGPGHAQYFDEILHRDPRPPRMIDPEIDPELERSCSAASRGRWPTAT
ncbi:MAG: serine/threonine-protein kinase [Isosphaeraceae bacterium]